MRRGGAFWGVLFIVLGGLFLINTLGILTVNAWRLFWPVLLILVGVWVMLGIGRRRGAPEGAWERRDIAIPLEGASRARITVRHGAGRLNVRGGAGEGQVLSGLVGPGMDYRTRRDGDRLDVVAEVGTDMWPRMFMPWEWFTSGAGEWTLSLNENVPIELLFEVGASETNLDLERVLVRDLSVQTGASSTTVRMPARAGYTSAKFSSGMAAVEVSVPEGVAARVKMSGGLADMSVDERRFPRSGDVYQSPDFDSAENKVEIENEGWVGSFKLR